MVRGGRAELHDGSRQVSDNLGKIRLDHVDRYVWAGTFMDEWARAIDIACGVGYGSYLLATNVPAIVTGYDKSDAAIAYAKAKYRMKGKRNQTCSFETFDMRETLPGGRGLNIDPVDYLCCFETLEHTKYAIAFLRHLSSLVTRLGFFSCPNEEAVPHDEKKHADHVRHYTPGEFRHLLEYNFWSIKSWHYQIDKQSPVYPSAGCAFEDLQFVKPRTLIAVAEPRRAA